jgi:hypothetical protein
MTFLNRELVWSSLTVRTPNEIITMRDEDSFIKRITSRVRQSLETKPGTPPYRLRTTRTTPHIPRCYGTTEKQCDGTK